MPQLKEGKGATKKRDDCVKRLEGKINPKTKKPYTQSERYAICTAAVQKSKNTEDSEDSTFATVDAVLDVLSDIHNNPSNYSNENICFENLKELTHTIGHNTSDIHGLEQYNELTDSTTTYPPNVITSSKTDPPKPDEVGLICFSEGPDWRRHYPGSTHAFLTRFARRPSTNTKRRSRLIALEEDGRLKQMIFRTGVFVHPWRGAIDADDQMLKDMKSNFDKGVIGHDLPMNVHHKNELGTLGYHDELAIEEDTFFTVRGDGKRVSYPGKALYSYTELTDHGYNRLIGSGQRPGEFLQASAEIYFTLRGQERFTVGDKKKDQRDKHVAVDETGTGKFMVYKNVLVGSAATNVPFVPQMRSFAASSDEVKEVCDEIKKKYGSLKAARVDLVQELNKRGIF